MKLLSSVLLFISSAAALSLEGVYKFQSNSKTSNGPTNTLSAEVIISKVHGREGQYSMVLRNVELESEKIKLASLPFEFQTKNGEIIAVKTDPRETIPSRNLKKAIAESLQTSTLDGSSFVLPQFGGSGLREVHFESSSEGNVKKVQSRYNRNDFKSFPEGSNIEKTDASINGMKTTTIDVEADIISYVNSKVELGFFKGNEQTTVVSESSISYIAPLVDFETEPASDLIEDSLVHEISYDQQISRLASIVGNPTEYIEKLLSEGVSKQDSLKMESKLLGLARLDENYANLIVESLLKKIEGESSNNRLYFILARVSSPLVDGVLSEKLAEAVSSKNTEMIYTILRAVNQMKGVNENSPLIKSLMSLEFPEEVKGMSELTIGSLCKFLSQEESDSILSRFRNEVDNASNERKVHLLHVLGNARDNTPKGLLASFLNHEEENIRSSAVFGLRGSIHNSDIQESVERSMRARPTIENKKMLFNLLKSMKENERHRQKRGSFDMIQNYLEELKDSSVVRELPDGIKQMFHERIAQRESRSEEPIKIASSTSVWNDSSDPLYNFAAPLSARQDDVNKYPSYEAFINAEMYGPRLANLKFVTGVFSGQGSPGCLAGNFKIFNHLYTETSFLGESRLLADLELYILTYDLTFDSRIYGNINGNVIVDFKLKSNCSSDEIPIFYGELDLIDYFAEFPIDLGTIDVTVRAIAGLEFDVGYKLCILVLNPYVELYLTGKIDLVGDAEVLVTVVGLIRAGIDADAYINYEIGPETQIGTRKNGTCEACIGIYYGYERQFFELELWFQRREGLGWGDPTVIPLFSWSEPAVPFPTTIIETCSEI